MQYKAPENINISDEKKGIANALTPLFIYISIFTIVSFIFSTLYAVGFAVISLTYMHFLYKKNIDSLDKGSIYLSTVLEIKSLKYTTINDHLLYTLSTRNPSKVIKLALKVDTTIDFYRKPLIGDQIPIFLHPDNNKAYVNNHWLIQRETKNGTEVV